MRVWSVMCECVHAYVMGLPSDVVAFLNRCSKNRTLHSADCLNTPKTSGTLVTSTTASNPRVMGSFRAGRADSHAVRSKDTIMAGGIDKMGVATATRLQVQADTA